MTKVLHYLAKLKAHNIPCALPVSCLLLSLVTFSVSVFPLLYKSEDLR